MRIAIISDTHDNIPNLEKTLAWLNRQGISLIIHCGDLCAPSILTEVILPKFSGKIHLVYGNVGDRELLEEKCQKLKNVKFCGDFGKIRIDNKNIAFVHKQKEAKKITQSSQYDLIFYGHSHKPWIEKLKIKNALVRLADGSRKKLKIVHLVNPGNLAGMFYKATFAVYDTETDKLELKILEKIRD